jgi:putative transposase
MPRQARVQYAGAIYHLMSRGDRQEDIFLDHVDRQDFLKTLAEACQKTGWQLHSYCLMRNHFHLVAETPEPNLVEGMRWLLSTYTIRLNHRHKLFGHVFSGRYKSLLVDRDSPGYLRTVCDYVHLNPVRAALLAPDEPLIAYPWSSLHWYAAGPAHRPSWIRTDRLLSEHGLRADTPATRAEFLRRMEDRRKEENDEQSLQTIRRGWCHGSAEFKQQILDRVEAQSSGPAWPLQHETSTLRAERILAEELARLGCSHTDLIHRRKNDPAKLAIAARLRKETTLTLKDIAQRLNLGTRKSANANIHRYLKSSDLQSPLSPSTENTAFGI